jgi:hypothetical protein
MSLAEQCQARIEAMISGKGISPDKVPKIMIAATGLSIAARDAERYAFLIMNESQLEVISSPEFEQGLRESLKTVHAFLRQMSGVLNGQ